VPAFARRCNARPGRAVSGAATAGCATRCGCPMPRTGKWRSAPTGGGADAPAAVARCAAGSGGPHSDQWPAPDRPLQTIAHWTGHNGMRSALPASGACVQRVAEREAGLPVTVAGRNGPHPLDAYGIAYGTGHYRMRRDVPTGRRGDAGWAPEVQRRRQAHAAGCDNATRVYNVSASPYYASAE
jgi:hypothetical protein